MHLYFQFILAVKYKEAQISSEWELELHNLIRNICAKQRCKLLAVGGMPDHLHGLIHFTPSTVLDNLMSSVKEQSVDWINAKKSTNCLFSWQDDYDALGVGLRQLDETVKYITDQHAIHAQINFLQEYELILKAHYIDYDPKDVYKPLADY